MPQYGPLEITCWQRLFAARGIRRFDRVWVRSRPWTGVATQVVLPRNLNASMKRLVRRSLLRLGWDVQRFDPAISEWAQLVKQLTFHEVTTVFDVGANIGQFASRLRDAGFQGRIISFEALASAHSQLAEQARHDQHWIVAPRVALGDRDGNTKINISGNSVSSSVLPMLSAHVSALPSSEYVASESVELRKLDTIAKDYVSDDDRTFLKLDVQGFEDYVLKGASRFLSRVVGIQMEMSLVPLYDGERLFDPMLHKLEELGFELWSLIPGFVDWNTGRLLQVDGVFFRSTEHLKSADHVHN
jgi:FkbM family methyltransferase